ncbi:MAG: chromosomal replication initiator protein DnaA [Lachnospiraceae bacterium]|nr:chromosomal replication initiator protein DnaA [Lachnospiraceae bacterium]
MNQETIREKWDWIKEHVRTEYRLSNISYKTFIQDMEIADIADNIVYIRIPTDKPIMLDYVVNNFKVFFEITITELVDENYHVEFILQDAKMKKETVREAAPVMDAPQVPVDSSNLIPRYRFDTFVVGRNNNFAQSACVAVAESPGKNYNPLFLYGGAGLGKTHLMHSIGHYILEMNPSKRVLYVTSEQFTNEVIESIRSGNATSMARLRDKYRTVDVLLIDDIQFIIGKESTQEEFFHTFNELHQAGKQIVLSSDRPPREMETLDERFRSRFEWGLIADIQPPDYETRMAILRKNCELTGRHLDDEILEYVATNIKSNIRELEGALNKIFAYSGLNNVDANLTNAREALKDIIDPDRQNIITPDMILRVVCEHYDVRSANIQSKKKNAALVVPRQVIMYICREYTDATLEQIAKLLGKRDHSTVMHGVKRIKTEISTNSELRGNVDVILKKLNITQ